MSAPEMSGVQEIIRQEVSSSFSKSFKYLDLIKDRLEAMMEKQDQRMEDLDELVIGFARDQKADYKKHLETVKGLLADHKIILEEIRTIYQGAKNDTRDLHQIATKHQDRLSSYYYNFYLKVLGIACLGGVSALVILKIITSIVLPLLSKIF